MVCSLDPSGSTYTVGAGGGKLKLKCTLAQGAPSRTTAHRGTSKTKTKPKTKTKTKTKHKTKVTTKTKAATKSRPTKATVRMTLLCNTV
jgi:hypothetical protein